MRYEVLESLPAYGPMHIPIAANDEGFYSEGFPVRFYKTDGRQWVANFQPGWTDLKTVIELDDTAALLILASGTCYLMDPDQQTPLAVFGVGYQNLFQADSGRVVLQDETAFTIVEPDGTYWHTDRISWDGLREVALNENLLTGLAYSPTHDADEWVPFSYNIDTKELTGGGF